MESDIIHNRIIWFVINSQRFTWMIKNDLISIDFEYWKLLRRGSVAYLDI